MIRAFFFSSFALSMSGTVSITICIHKKVNGQSSRLDSASSTFVCARGGKGEGGRGGGGGTPIFCLRSMFF